MNTWADSKLVDSVLAQKDYTSFARAIENVPSFDLPNIHGSGHFGVGGAQGTMGNAANSPGGTPSYLHCERRVLTRTRAAVLFAPWKPGPYLLGVAANGSADATESSWRACCTF